MSLAQLVRYREDLHSRQSVVGLDLISVAESSPESKANDVAICPDPGGEKAWLFFASRILFKLNEVWFDVTVVILSAGGARGLTILII